MHLPGDLSAAAGSTSAPARLVTSSVVCICCMSAFVSYAVSCLYALLVDAFVSGYLVLSSFSLPPSIRTSPLCKSFHLLTLFSP